ncbi:MAG TPA: hypothetical protein DEB31_04125, partial [Clostridiales bacterium]|nr:hypothetical protein [Clostridiales bacterium]
MSYAGSNIVWGYAMLEKEIRELEGGLLSFPHEDTQPLPGGRRISAVWKKQLLRLLFLLLYPLAFLLRDLAAANPDWAEQAFAQGFYPGFSSAVGSVFGWMPFSFSEFLVYALLILLGVWIIRTIISAVKKKLRLVNLVRTLITFALIGGVGMNLFYVMWGFNYSRYSVAYTLNLNVEEQPPQALADLCVLLAKQANALRAQQAEDEHGTFFYEEGNSGILKKIPGAYAALAQDYPQFARSIAIPAPKPVLASEMMSYAGISGIYIPFTEEANVNVHQPPLLVAFAGAHESAHFLGVCREDEANFISYLACLYS